MYIRSFSTLKYCRSSYVYLSYKYTVPASFRTAVSHIANALTKVVFYLILL